MTNFELTKIEIHEAWYMPNGLLDHVDATVTSAFSLEMTLTRREILDFINKQGFGVYFKGKKLLLDKIGLDRLIKIEKSSEERDILE